MVSGRHARSRKANFASSFCVLPAALRAAGTYKCPLWVKSRHCDKSAMSALPPEADMRSATRYVRFVPIADIVGSSRTAVGHSGHSTLTGSRRLRCLRLGSRGARANDFLRTFYEFTCSRGTPWLPGFPAVQYRHSSTGPGAWRNMRRARAIAGRIRGAGCAPERAIAVRVCLQRCLEFAERSSRLSHF